MQRWVLTVSLVVNVVLVVALVWSRGYVRSTNFQMLADATQAEVKLQQHVLTEIESGDTARLDAVAAMLRRNVQLGQQAATNWQTAANQ